MSLPQLIESDAIPKMIEQLNKYKSVLDLAKNELLNERSKQSIILQASGEFDQFTIMVSDYYDKLSAAALPPSKPKELKKKETSEDDETQNSMEDTPIIKPNKPEPRGRAHTRTGKM